MVAASSNSTSNNPGATRISCRHPPRKSCNKNRLFNPSSNFVIIFNLSNNLIIIFDFFVTYNQQQREYESSSCLLNRSCLLQQVEMKSSDIVLATACCCRIPKTGSENLAFLIKNLASRKSFLHSRFPAPGPRHLTKVDCSLADLIQR